MPEARGRVRLTELLASISLATDTATGQPMGHGIRTCLLAVPMARALGCDEERVRSVHQVSLLRFLGCTAEASGLAESVGGNELTFNRIMAPSLYGSAGESLVSMIGAIGPDRRPASRARLLLGALSDSKSSELLLESHCEVASMLATRLGLDQAVVTALAHAYERWDGKGFPQGLKGEDVPLEIRICSVARDIDLAIQTGEDPMRLLAKRRGKAYDPEVVDAYSSMNSHPREADWEALLRTEPTPPTHVDDADKVLEVLADFVDLKSPWTRGHSRKVADLAENAAREAGVRIDQVVHLRRAGLVHDLGRLGVENGVWDKPGSLSVDESERVRLHPYLTHRILSRCEPLAPLAQLASHHHERLDGSGYHGQLTEPQISWSDRILAAADVMAALTSARPHRASFTLDEATEVMRGEVSDGRLDADAVACVVIAAGGAAERPKQPNPGGLSDREVEVLRLIAKERTNREMAEELYISPKTVGRHVENIYSKIGVSTRAGAAVYAMEEGLLG